MIAASIRELLDREPFVPFRIVASSGESFTVRDPHLVALLKSQVFIAEPNSDNRTYVPYLHVASVATIENGHAGKAARRKRKG
jgi:hypothetical protein